ncbi:hypothetical protein [Mycobacterium sp. 236(2023)]|uniref:hypothetical protein n=1 Tax=Mycobacterium sp. 236(2023) TaxID=3038163 RepID=UPI0024152790|nr:hypothetical protein [Mycobacterium sp. 236(2023)]MDG4667831.1 hypothetical protein [Mycobacterium sp. 236(2023)]
MAHTGLDVREFVSRILDLAATDSSRAWQTLVSDLGVLEVGEYPRSVVACHHGRGHLDAGRLTGRWPGVVGARQAHWLILPARDTMAHRVLVSRKDATIEATGGYAALDGAGVADVTVTDLAVDPTRIVGGGADAGVLAAAGAAAVVVGSANGLWHSHVERLRTQLASSSDAITDAVAAQVAAAASDIDAARLQITELSSYRQAIARARAAADRLLEHSRHALDASHPVTLRWREVDLGSRLAVRVLDGLSTQLG